MIKDLHKYFVAEQQYFLNRAEYRMIEDSEQLEEYQLNCTDSVSVDLKDNVGIRIVFTRILNFNPENLFEISVSFGAILNFKKNEMGKIKWQDMNLAEEFRDNGEFVLNNLVSRTSLLIAQITSSFGQAPVVTPPSITKNN